jgi:hypothetical protein
MGLQHRIDDGVVEMVVAGRFSVDELLAGFREMLEDEDLPPDALVLINGTASEVLPPYEVMERIASTLTGGREKLGTRLAFLVAHTVRFGKARQLGALLEPAGIFSQPFYDREEAIRWLKADEVDT